MFVNLLTLVGVDDDNPAIEATKAVEDVLKILSHPRSEEILHRAGTSTDEARSFIDFYSEERTEW